MKNAEKAKDIWNRLCSMRDAKKEKPYLLISEALTKAREEERERCAVIAENVVPRHTECGRKIAAAIRNHRAFDEPGEK